MKDCPLCGRQMEDGYECDEFHKIVCGECIHGQTSRPDEWHEVCDECMEEKFDGR